MKRILLFVTILFFLSACGGGGGSESGSKSTPSSTSNKQKTTTYTNSNATTYNLWSYIIPTSLNVNSFSNRSLESYSAKFREIDRSTIVEKPKNLADEKIEYQKDANKISVTFYKNDKQVYRYYLKKEVKIGERTTLEDSSCVLVNHFNDLMINNKHFKDVIEIDCGQHKGYYAKGFGEIAKEE